MRCTKGRIVLATAAALAVMVGAGTAVAGSRGGGGGGDLKRTAAHISQRAAFEALVAGNLGTTEAKLKAAVKASARANIAAALAADRITAAEAETLNEALTDGSVPAMRLATAAGVAKQLDITVARLNDACSSAAKARVTARVDQALKDGKITAAAAAEMKAKIADARFPGFGAGGPGHRGHGRGGPGQRGMGGPGGGGMGFGPQPGAGPPADRPS
ncbi:MAG: hypothetical protein EXQ81_11105 [Thermoleophilia bacterium]|nr:hypothetical protein [Thermoleophilia bacterium]